MNEEGAAQSQTIPWLWLDQRRCDGTTLPTKSDAIEPTGIEFRAFARFGDVAAHQDMISDPLGKAPIALGKPTSTTPFGIRGHVLSDSVNGRTAGDIAGRIELPPQLVVYRPLMSTCNDSTPPNEIATCQSLPMYSRDQKTQFRMKLLGTIDEYGAADVLVRLRGHHDRNDPDAPVAPDACTPPPGGGEPLCDLDITGRDRPRARHGRARRPHEREPPSSQRGHGPPRRHARQSDCCSRTSNTCRSPCSTTRTRRSWARAPTTRAS